MKLLVLALCLLIAPASSAAAQDNFNLFSTLMTQEGLLFKIPTLKFFEQLKLGCRISYPAQERRCLASVDRLSKLSNMVFSAKRKRELLEATHHMLSEYPKLQLMVLPGA